MFWEGIVMTMTRIWTGMIMASIVFGLVLGRGEAVAAAAMSGAQSAFELAFSIGGMLCLWSGVMKVMSRSGLAERLARLLAPALRRLFPQSSRDQQTQESIAANISANVLGLGNAATPLGLKAIGRMAQKSGTGVVTDEMCTLVVCNAASIQLIPTTVGAVRMAAGSRTPFDILPAVWLTSAAALCVGLFMCRLMRRFWKE